MSQERLTSLVILSIKNELARYLNYYDIIVKLAKEKVRKLRLSATINRI